MFTFPRKTHMLLVNNEPQECIWCKREFSEADLTLEHINGYIEPKKRIIKLACKPCNNLHGGIMGQFIALMDGSVRLGQYTKTMIQLSTRTNFFKIIASSWFDISLDQYRFHSLFRWNPTRLTYGYRISDTEIAYATDAYFIRRVKTKLYLWRTNELQRRNGPDF